MNRFLTEEEVIKIIHNEWLTGTGKEEIIEAFFFLPGFNEKIFRTQLDYLFGKWEKEKLDRVWKN